MKRSMAMAMAATLLLSLVVLTVDAWARAGGGGSSGSRGSRSYSAPARPAPGPVSPGSAVSPSRPSAPTNFQQPQRSGWMSGLMGGLGGLLVGGLIGSMLFGGLGHGLGGGLGLIEILLMAALAYFAFSWFRRRQAPVPATPAGYAPAGYAPSGYAPAPAPVEWRPDPVARTAAVAEAPSASSDLEQGVSHIRQMDGSFDPRRFGEEATDIFFKVQAAWMARDMATARAVLTDEMVGTMQRDCDRLRSERRINRLENIAVRSVDVSEAWQERGQDFVTVGFVANLLDFTTDESGAQVLEGSRTEPVKFEEFWTFTRPVGPNAWKLSAIQQPA